LLVAAGSLGALEKFMDAREGAARHGRPCFDGLIRPVKIIPRKGLHVGPEDQIGVSLPGLGLVFLSRMNGACDHLKDIGRRAALSILDSHLHAEDECRAQVSCGASGNWGDKAAIG
jgi:hypothetical protein